jgi:hypothetical protein
MRASRGMGCIKKGATGKFAKKPVALKKGGTVKDACYKKVKAII